jgi:hypothetical protein
MDRRGARARSLIAVLAVAGSVAACAPASATQPPPAASAGSVADLGRAWSEAPSTLSSGVLASAEGACREQAPEAIPAGSPLALADSRGGARVILVFAPPGAAVSCDAKINADRSWTAVVRPGIDGPPPGARQATVALVASASDIRPIGAPVERTTLFGRTGPGVDAVDVLLEASVVRATTANGWFVAWWPSDDDPVAIQARDAAGLPLESAHG